MSAGRWWVVSGRFFPRLRPRQILRTGNRHPSKICYVMGNFGTYLLILFWCLTFWSKITPPETCFFFFDHLPVPLHCTYVLCTQGRHNISLIEDLVWLRAQKHNPTMASTASPRAANPKMVKSPASMAHASSSYVCAEDGYFKVPIRQVLMEIFGWRVVGFLLVLELADVWHTIS